MTPVNRKRDKSSLHHARSVVGFRLLERPTTNYFIITILILVAAVIVGFALAVALGTDLEALSRFVDAVTKCLAVLIGTVWALNRYFTSRTDVVQLRVDAGIDTIRSNAFSNSQPVTSGLLAFRLDIVNTGKSLIAPFHQLLEVHAVQPSETGGIEYVEIARWPAEGLHPGGPIEPGSWSALNSEIPIRDDVKAVRLYLELHLEEDRRWTWHKTFGIPDSITESQDLPEAEPRAATAAGRQQGQVDRTGS